MMKPRARVAAPPPVRASEEQSGVRVRTAETGSSKPPSRPQNAPLEPPREVARCLRIEQKVRMGQLVLDALPLSDARARLLRTALVRRDEVLIDAVLEELRMLA